MRTHAFALAFAFTVLPACGHRPSAGPRTPSATALQGTIDARPFVARAGFARRRRNGGIDIFFYERDATAPRPCEDPDSTWNLDDAERLVWVQMPWPVTGGDLPFEVSTTSGWGAFLHVQRGHGSTSTRATGSLTVERSHADGGTLLLDVATENDGDLHGSVSGAMAFSICPR